MRCPRCDQALVAGGWDEAAAHSPYRVQICQTLELYQCSKCRGTWLPFSSLGEALRELAPRVLGAGADRDALTAAVARVQSRWEGDHETMNVAPKLLVSCPQCRAPMGKLRSRAKKFVLYDRCEACRGLWFDQGELERIVQALTDGLKQIASTLGTQR